MKWIVQGKDLQQQDALVLSHSREDAEVGSICKNLRLLKVKLTTNPPSIHLHRLVLQGTHKVLHKAQLHLCDLLLTFHDSLLCTKPPQQSQGKGKIVRLKTSTNKKKKAGPQSAETSSCFQCDPNIAAHPLEKFLSSASSSFVLLHLHPSFCIFILCSLGLGSAGAKPRGKGLPRLQSLTESRIYHREGRATVHRTLCGQVGKAPGKHKSQASSLLWSPFQHSSTY